MTDRLLTEEEKAELRAAASKADAAYAAWLDDQVPAKWRAYYDAIEILRQVDYDEILSLLDEIAALTNLLRDTQQEQAKLALALEGARKERGELRADFLHFAPYARAGTILCPDPTHEVARLDAARRRWAGGEK